MEQAPDTRSAPVHARQPDQGTGQPSQQAGERRPVSAAPQFVDPWRGC